MNNTKFAYFPPIFIIAYILLFLISPLLKVLFRSSNPFLHFFENLFDAVPFIQAVFSWIILPIFGILAILLGLRMLKEADERKTLAKANIFIGIISIILGLINIIILLIGGLH